MAVVLALCAAASWGLADFLGGLASRRFSVPLVLLLIQGTGLALVLAVVLITREPFFADRADALSAAGSGLAGILSLGCFYRALAIGTMSVVAPISSAGVALPVVVGLLTGDRPSALAASGLALIVCGVVLASRESHDTVEQAAASRTSILLALVAAVGFGGFFALSDAPSDASVLWTLALARASALPLVAAVVLVTRPPLPPRRIALGLGAVGAVDLIATGFIAVANTKGDLSIVSVLGGMYPVATMLLAAAVLHERLQPPQLVGVVMALGGVAAVATG